MKLLSFGAASPFAWPHRFRSVVVAFAAALAACILPPAGRDLKLDPRSRSGLLVASFTHGDGGILTWRYRRVGSKSSAMVQVDRRAPDAIAGGEQILYAFELPAGEYEIFAWQNEQGARSVHPFSVRFRVGAGRVTYAGNLELGWEYVRDSHHFSLDVKDLAAFDVPLFLRNYPNVHAEQIQVALMHAGDASPPAPVAYGPRPLPALPVASLPEAPDGPGALTVRFTGPDQTDRRGAVRGMSLSDKFGDAAMGAREFSAGVITYTGQAGLGRGSAWAAVGVRWDTQEAGSTDASAMKTVTFRLASNAGRLRLTLRGFDVIVEEEGCFPIQVVEVTEELKEYTLPLSSFVPPEGCRAARSATAAEALSRLRGFQAVAVGPPRPEPVVIAVGTTTLRP